MNDTRSPFEAEAAEIAAKIAEDSMEIPAAYRNATMETLNGSQASIGEQCAKELLSGANIFLQSRSGIGKTWMAVALGRMLNGKGTHGKFINVPMLFAGLRDDIDSKGFRLTDLVNDLAGLGWLILDDLGSQRTTDWSLETLYLIVNQRSFSGKGRLIVTSNLTLDGIAHAYTDRIASRIGEACKIVRMQGPDRRLERIDNGKG